MSDCMYPCILRALDSLEMEVETVRTSTDSSEPLCGCWQSNPGPAQGQPVLVPAGPALQPHPSVNLNFPPNSSLLVSLVPR